MKKIDLNPYLDSINEYAEIRVQENKDEKISIVNGNIMKNTSVLKSGVSARVYKKSKWGFCSLPEITPQAISKVIKQADENADFLSKKEKSEINLDKLSGEYYNDFSFKENHKTQKEKINFLQELENYLNKTYPELSAVTIVLNNLSMEKQYANTHNASNYSFIPRSNLYLTLSITNDNIPTDIIKVYGGFGNFEDNFQSIESLKPEIEEQYKHLVNKTKAVFAQSGEKECILDSHLAGILAHESIGHLAEADFVSSASILRDRVGKQIASEMFSLTDFAHHYKDTLCHVPVFMDDEGTPASDVRIIENGILKNFMHSKESAHKFNVKATGNARAFDYSDDPIIRMRNTAILPGNNKLDEMISSIDDGYYFINYSNGEADDTSEFMFGVTLGYEIKKGKLGKAVKDTTISGVALNTLKTISMISDGMKWNCTGFCGKMQMIPVSFGGPAVKCRINVGGR
mgnify:CR=1 FL=1